MTGGTSGGGDELVGPKLGGRILEHAGFVGLVGGSRRWKIRGVKAARRAAGQQRGSGSRVVLVDGAAQRAGACGAVGDLGSKERREICVSRLGGEEEGGFGRGEGLGGESRIGAVGKEAFQQDGVLVFCSPYEGCFPWSRELDVQVYVTKVFEQLVDGLDVSSVQCPLERFFFLWLGRQRKTLV